MDRRRFIKLCSSALALAGIRPDLAGASEGPLQRRKRVRLVDAAGKSLGPGDLELDKAYVFFYPFAGTPCYLIRLGTLTRSETLKTENGTAYEWKGGAGPNRNVVAFSAICTHLLTHPTRKISFINYHSQADKLSGRENVISCCAHGSVFDPARGAKVLSGPATQPLPAIALEHNEQDGALYAVGTVGADVFEDFFDDFKGELREEHGRGKARQEVKGAALVTALNDYTGHKIPC
ncbi:MAG: Rieske 2Fe-2S domain-containing protein [Gammaproteobacteria bacterium]|nr:Rieske 2Fe-2S domain-containing protein [Gammaproteobacteria bacterium]NIR99041.1 Rieske 2Fe-2S domain-containing protein [Gammaproteobacteria bacterium]NIT64664.1 Rieske 2Fe-2S domain-containing protein [Gammaproteobacteria bacterium]NIY33244.1 Rieske 2Fe-2S domain-containing protein [Gammaproteobacteria bacterium]